MEPAWFCLEEATRFDPKSLAETLLGGQAFRWFIDREHDCWTGTWDRHVVSLRINAAGALQATAWTNETTGHAIRHYLGADRLPGWISQIPLNADPVLESLFRNWGRISILRQPPGEALLAFICSSNKQILQIRSMLQALSTRFGEPLPGTPFHRLPAWEELASVGERRLRECALGYRAAHVAGTAAFLAKHPGYLEAVKQLPTPEARIALLELPGVGPKVADCVLLFGYGRADAFPVDTWIDKILRESYPGLESWSRPQLATFAGIHFGRAGGLAQQWFFAEARSRDRILRKREGWPEAFYSTSAGAAKT